MKTIFGLALAGVIGAIVSAPLWAQEKGPKGGPAAEWGKEEYHVEVLVDAKAGTVTAYVYGNDEDLKNGKRKPIDSKTITVAFKSNPPVTVKLEATPEKEDPAGKTSKFVGKSDKLPEKGKLSGTVSGKVGNKPYTGDFKEE
jgi:hypothetical protein